MPAEEAIADELGLLMAGVQRTEAHRRTYSASTSA
jgi:hypothetical protein